MPLNKQLQKSRYIHQEVYMFSLLESTGRLSGFTGLDGTHLSGTSLLSIDLDELLLQWLQCLGSAPHDPQPHPGAGGLGSACPPRGDGRDARGQAPMGKSICSLFVMPPNIPLAKVCHVAVPHLRSPNPHCKVKWQRAQVEGMMKNFFNTNKREIQF